MNKLCPSRQGFAFFIIILFIVLTFTHSISGSIKKNNNASDQTSDYDDDTEYWALLIAVGKYFLHPFENRPLMLEALDDMHETLISSENWQSSHIKIIQGQRATLINILRGFFWLDTMEDSNDISVIWIATHGYHMRRINGNPIDRPPFDESDGSDEALVTYFGFSNLLLNLRDDVLNLLLDRLESKGICFIVDSCYNGGFNDSPAQDYIGDQYEYSASTFLQGLAEDVAGQNRVVLMSAGEDTPSWFSRFSMYLAEGLLGPADIIGDSNGVVSAEEGFFYAKPLVEDSSDGKQCPTILDLFPGELPLIHISN